MSTGIRAIFTVAVVASFYSVALATDPSVTRSSAGDAIGKVVKINPGSITISEPVKVQAGVKYHTVGAGPQRHRVAVPTYSTKYVETTVALARDAKVKTAAGKAANLTDVHPGLQVQLHTDRVVERTPGEKPATRYEVTRLVIPTASN